MTSTNDELLERAKALKLHGLIAHWQDGVLAVAVPSSQPANGLIWMISMRRQMPGARIKSQEDLP